MHDRPVGRGVSDSETAPERPLIAVTVIVELPEDPASIWLGETGPALIVKSCPSLIVTLNVLWKVIWKLMYAFTVSVTIVTGDIAVPLASTCIVLRSSIEESGTVTLYEPTVPGGAVVVKLTAVALDAELVTGVLLWIEQPVPQLEVAVKMNLTAAECESVPIMPVTVTVAFAAIVDVQDSVAICGELPKVTLGRVHEKPVGSGVSESDTVPVRPLRAVTVIVEVSDMPTGVWAGDAGLADIVKSTTWKRIAAVECDSVPSVPVTVTV